MTYRQLARIPIRRAVIRGMGFALSLGMNTATTTVRTCHCGINYDRAGWAQLKVIGRQDFGDGDVIVMKNCPCGNTMALPEEV